MLKFAYILMICKLILWHILINLFDIQNIAVSYWALVAFLPFFPILKK